MKPILALARKDLLILFRVRSGLFFTFVWPIVVAVLFGAVMSGPAQGGSPRLTVAMVDEDRSDGSRAFIDRIEKSGDFRVTPADAAAARDLVRRGERSAYLVLKPGFGAGGQRMFYGAPREVELGIDPARQAESGMIEGLLLKHAMADMQLIFSDPAAARKNVGSAIADLQSQAGNSSAAAPVARFLGELDTFLATPQPAAPGGAGAQWQPLHVTKTSVARERRGPANAFQVTFPQGIMWGIIGCVMTFAIGLVSERVHGTFFRLRTAPLTSAQILAGKALACVAAITLVQAMILAIGTLFFSVAPASWPLLLAACACAALCFVGFMMMIAGLGKTEQAVSGAGWAVLMPLTLVGGGMMPQFLMPQWMLTVSHVSPVKWTILALEGALWREFTAAEMALPCGILLGFGVVCFAVGVRGMRR